MGSASIWCVYDEISLLDCQCDLVELVYFIFSNALFYKKCNHGMGWSFEVLYFGS